MKYGIKTNGQMIPVTPGPNDWPALTVSYQNDDAKTEQNLISEGFTIMGEISYNAYIAAHQAEYDAWAAINLKDGLIQSIRDRIDIKTDEMIDTGFIYQDMHFRTDVAHQNSYMFDYLLCQTYPHTVKGVGEDYITFADRNEHTMFIGTGFGTIDAIIRLGWDLKDGLEALTYSELLVWVDPRL